MGVLDFCWLMFWSIEDMMTYYVPSFKKSLTLFVMSSAFARLMGNCLGLAQWRCGH